MVIGLVWSLTKVEWMEFYCQWLVRTPIAINMDTSLPLNVWAMETCFGLHHLLLTYGAIPHPFFLMHHIMPLSTQTVLKPVRAALWSRKFRCNHVSQNASFPVSPLGLDRHGKLVHLTAQRPHLPPWWSLERRVYISSSSLSSSSAKSQHCLWDFRPVFFFLAWFTQHDQLATWVNAIIPFCMTP